jgi:hypothetical protein
MENIFEILKKYGLEFLSKYSDYDYKTDRVKYNDVFDYTTYEVSFLSFEAKRVIDISFNCYTKSKKKSVNITVNTFKDYNNHYDYIMLSDYLRTKMGIKDYYKLLVVKNQDDIEKEVRVFFNNLSNLIDVPFIEIIKGTKWIDIPFDWSLVNK